MNTTMMPVTDIWKLLLSKFAKTSIMCWAGVMGFISAYGGRFFLGLDELLSVAGYALLPM